MASNLKGAFRFLGRACSSRGTTVGSTGDEEWRAIVCKAAQETTRWMVNLKEGKKGGHDYYCMCVSFRDRQSLSSLGSTGCLPEQSPSSVQQWRVERGGVKGWRVSDTPDIYLESENPLQKISIERQPWGHQNQRLFPGHTSNSRS